jgi:cell division protein FtsB
MSAEIVPIVSEDSAQKEAKLRTLWARERALEEELKGLRARIAPLHLEVARERGFFMSVSREVLERELTTKK